MKTLTQWSQQSSTSSCPFWVVATPTGHVSPSRIRTLNPPSLGNWRTSFLPLSVTNKSPLTSTHIPVMQRKSSVSEKKWLNCFPSWPSVPTEPMEKPPSRWGSFWRFSKFRARPWVKYTVPAASHVTNFGRTAEHNRL